MFPKPPPPPANGRPRLRRSSIPNAPQHASAVIFEMGEAGHSWPEIVAILNGWNFRTARFRRWTVLSARQYWHQVATMRMKIARGRALEVGRGIRSSYLERLRKTIPDTGGAVL